MENDELITRALRYIQSSPQENLSLGGIAEQAGFSLSYFDALFRRQTGYTAIEYARIYKLTRAALSLRRTDKTVLDIALDFGYANPENFARAFRSFYGESPAEYREKRRGEPVTWHELSSRVAISRFEIAFPELRRVSVDAALDFVFTHNPELYAEDIVGLTTAQSAAFTEGDPDEPEHFIYVSDYNDAVASVGIVCAEEDPALRYMELLHSKNICRISIHRVPGSVWNKFDARAEALGYSSRVGYDMLYPDGEVSVPEFGGMTVRELTPADMPLVREFRDRGGCAECHVRGLEGYFDGKANAGERGFGLFICGVMEGLATPVLDEVRGLRKFDIGAIFVLGRGSCGEAILLLWKHVIDYALRRSCKLGNADARPDDTPLGIAYSEKAGLIKVAEKLRYSK